MQPHILNGTSNGHVVIDVVKDAKSDEWPPIVLDINNITITKAQGNSPYLSYISAFSLVLSNGKMKWLLI